MKTLTTAISSFFIALIFASSADINAQVKLAGNWNGQDWGQVTINQNGATYSGTYSDTYGTGAGTFKFNKDPQKPSQFVGTWRESNKRFGTFVLVPNATGTFLNVNWNASAASTVGDPNAKASSIWAKLNPHKWQPIVVSTARYGANSVGNGLVMSGVAAAGSAALGTVAPNAAIFVNAVPAAFSINKAVDVFVVYGCVDQVTRRVDQVYGPIQLDDADASAWWASGLTSFRTRAAERRSILAKAPAGAPPCK